MKLGRLPRTYNPAIPHMSALLAGKKLAVPPAAVDQTAGMPANLGMMLNDSLGDCTCAAYYHALQIWSHQCNPHGMITQPDNDVLQLYEKACGYNPADPSTDQGGVEQNVLTYLLKTGAPVVGTKGTGVHHLTAFVEVDPRMTDDIKWTINDCGACYIGMSVPNFIMNSTPPSVWDVDPGGDNGIDGGHAVIVGGYDATGVKFISWGQFYTMTWAFWNQFVDESYALADSDWIDTKKTTPGGLSIAQLKQQMQALKEAA